MDFKAGLYDSDGDPISDSTYLKVKIKRDADDYFYDFDDSTFKASGHTTIAQQLAEFDQTNAPGEYELTVSEAAWDDGMYTGYYNYDPGDNTKWTDECEFPVYNGEYAENNVILTDVADLNTLVLRVLGLAQENFYQDNIVWDSSRRLTSCRLRLYSDAASVGTTSNVLATYTITATYDSSDNLLETYKVVKS